MNWPDDGWMSWNILPDLQIHNKTICYVPNEYNNIYLIFVIISLTGNPKVFIRNKWRLGCIKRFLFVMRNSINSSPSQTPISSIRSPFCLLILARLLILPNSPSSCPFSSSVTFFRLYWSSLHIEYSSSWILYPIWSSTIKILKLSLSLLNLNNYITQLYQ